MPTVHLESHRVAKLINFEMRARGKSFLEAISLAALDAHERAERKTKTITAEALDAVGSDEAWNAAPRGKNGGL